MRKLLFLLLLLSLVLKAMEIDYEILEEIVNDNPTAIKERIILAKNYEKNSNDLKALSLIQEVLAQDPKNQYALNIQRKIKAKEHVKTVLREAGLSQPVNAIDAQKRLDSYYKVNNYQFFSNLYQALVLIETPLEDSYHIKAAYIYLWDGRYKESKKALEMLQHANNLDAAKIEADICYYTGKYNCAIRLYEKLYRASANKDIGIKLINSYIYQGELSRAQRIYTVMKRRYPRNQELVKLGSKITKLKNSYINSTKDAYEKNANYDTLAAYASALYATGEKEKTLLLLREYNEKNPSNNSLVLEARYLVWMNRSSRALKILGENSLSNDLNAKLLLGKVYSWDGEYAKAKKLFKEIIIQTRDDDLLFKAKKALGYVYLWEKNYSKAKEIFIPLYRERKRDKEVREALMELNHDYKGLIKIYRGRHSFADIKRLAELYILDKQPKKAIRYLKEYVDANPDDLEAMKNLGQLLVSNKDYYQGFGYLEYYVAQKKTSEASLLLAKNYYWSGFSKEALDVLNELLKIEPENEQALELKAKILKVAPRFTTSNSGATILSYYNDLGKKQLYLADTLYFNAHYSASLKYYEDYLQSHPNDHDARYRYAFALENSGLYGKAEGEFSLLFWSKDSDELRYHYAYNMMKNGKYIESKKLLNELKGKTYRKIDPKLDTFLNDWKKSWESMNYTEYASFYDDRFNRNEIWAYTKQTKFLQATYIAVAIYDPVSKNLDKNNSYEIQFFQEYSTNKHKDMGYKTLEIQCDANQTNCKITKESWIKGKYQKKLLLEPYIDKALKDNEILKTNPLAFSKKKSLSNGTLAKETTKPKPKKYHDIYLAAGLKKDYKNEENIFDKGYVSTLSSSKLNSSQVYPSTGESDIYNYLNLDAYYLKDSDGFGFQTIDLAYKRARITQNTSLAADIGLMEISQNDIKYNGIRYGGTLFYKHFSLRLGMNDFDDFSEFVPTLKYNNTYKNHTYELEYTHQNALFYTYSIVPYEKRISADHFRASDVILFENKTELWVSSEVNFFSNSDIGFIGQFDWTYYTDSLWTPKFTYGLAVEGYYVSNTKPNNDYFSPHFADSTLLRIDPRYRFSRYFSLRSKIGIGYSVSADSTPYKYGLWGYGEPVNSLTYEIGCLESNTARIGNSTNYYYTECNANLWYSW